MATGRHAAKRGHIKHDLVSLLERANAPVDVAGRGQVWVKTATPNEVWFTDDAGTDFQLGGSGSVIDVQDESTDTTCFPLFVKGALGSQGAKSGSNLTFNSNNGDLVATLFAGIANANLVDKSAVEKISAQWTFDADLIIDNGNSLVIYDPTTTDKITLSHDGTNALWVNSTTTNIIMSGHTGYLELSTTSGDEMLRLTDSVADGAGAVMFIAFYDTNSRQAALGIGSASDEIFRITTDAATSGIRLQPGNSIVDFNSVIRVQERAAALADLADYGQFWVKSDIPNTPQFTTDTGVDGQLARLNAQEIITGAWLFLNDGGWVIKNSAGSGRITIAYDGTDINFTHSNVTDWNISGVTKIQAGTVDADFDAITATSYGGITEAKLLDKSAAEIISGAYTFSGLASFTNVVTSSIDGSILISDALPLIAMRQTTASTDNKVWDIIVAGEQLRFRTALDVGTTQVSWMLVDRTGTTIDKIALQATDVTTSGTFAVAGNIGFYGQGTTAKPTGVAVTAAGIHAALVTLNLIAA